MVTIKSKTISTAHFESEIIAIINAIKKGVPDDSFITKESVLNLLRDLHSNCLEYVKETKDEDFKILKELQS